MKSKIQHNQLSRIIQTHRKKNNPITQLYLIFVCGFVTGLITTHAYLITTSMT